MATFAIGFKPANNGAGVFPLSTGGPQAIDAVSTTQNYALGTRIKAIDPVLGEAEFIYAKGVTSTAQFNFVVINADFTTTRAAGGTAKGRVGVAMAALDAATKFGWYCIFGRVPVTIAADVGAVCPAYGAAAGVIADDIVATNQIAGMSLEVALNAGGSDIVGTTDTTAANTAIAFLTYPSAVLAV
jgi:hypothetical protein